MALVVYSTGPVENESGTIYAPETLYSTVAVNGLNNSKKKTATITATLFGLNGEKTEVDTQSFDLDPQGSDSVEFDVSLLDRFEIQIQIQQKGKARSVKKKVLVSATGKDDTGAIVNILPLTLIKAKP